MIVVATELTKEMLFASSFLRLYPVWTDGYPESFAEYFDRATYYISREEKLTLTRGIDDLSGVMKAMNDFDERWNSLGLIPHNKANYETSLSRMRYVLYLHRE